MYPICCLLEVGVWLESGIKVGVGARLALAQGKMGPRGLIHLIVKGVDLFPHTIA